MSIFSFGSIYAEISWSLSDDGTLTISGTGMPNFDSDPNPWASKRDEIKKVVIKKGVTNIGTRAFWCCPNIESITIPETVKSIGDEAFYYCIALTSINIPSSVTSIGNFAFQNCESLTSISLPNSVKSIGVAVFQSCISLTSFTIPNSLTSIEDCMFSGCEKLSSVTIPNSVKSIKDRAFQICHSLTSVTIPNSVTSIEYCAFEDCYSLTSITIPGSVKEIGVAAFAGCKGLVSVTLLDGIANIGNSAFEVCSNLVTVTIPSSVTSIGERAFGSCTNLSSITCEAVTPPPYLEYGHGFSRFEYVDRSIPVFVPENSVEAYKAALDWSEFTSIRPIGHYFVTLDHNKGVGDPEQILVAYNQPMPENIGLVAPTRTGYVFNGYSSNGKYYYDANMNSVRNFDKQQDFTLLANWKLRTTTVTLNQQSGKDGTAQVTATYGKAMPMGENIVAPTRTGYTFEGYYSSTNGKGTQYYNADMTSKRSWNKDVASITLYAYWKIITIPVTDIALSDATATLWVDEEKALTATVTPTNATNAAVTWTSSNTAVATVSANGLIKAIAKGTATITCKATDGSGIYRKCTVTVKQPVTSIALSATDVNLWVGKTKTVTATVSPTTATKTSVIWSSSDDQVATVSTRGVIKATGRGTCIITCTAADGYGTKAECEVTVKQQVTSIDFGYETLSVTCGTTKTLTPNIYPSDANVQKLTWKSKNTSVARVSSEGVLTAVAPGTAQVICTATDGFKKADTITVEVVPLQITDSKPTIASGTYGAGGISYIRTLTEGKYAAFCLPYTVNLNDYTDEFSKVYVPMGIALYKSNGTVMISLKKVSLTETIRAGQPFVAVAAKSGSVAVVNDAKVTIASLAEPKEKKLEVYDLGSSFITYNPDIEVKITGNYAKITGLDNTNNFIFSTSGSMSKATSVSPYRLYVTKNDEHSDAKITDIQFSFEEDETVTGIEDLKIANEESPVDESTIYNLKGQRVNRANAQQKGVYIKNGKKVIVK